MNTLFCYYLCSSSITQNNIGFTIFIGILCSFFAVLIYNLFQGISLYQKMKKINGIYLEFDKEDNQRVNSKCAVKFKLDLSILLGSGPYLKINQTNPNKLWESKLPISVSNPLIAFGTYKYKNYKTWGTLNIIINLEDEIIYVKAEDNIKVEKDRIIAEYWLKKKPPLARRGKNL